jgi:SM-20-related protein
LTERRRSERISIALGSNGGPSPAATALKEVIAQETAKRIVSSLTLPYKGRRDAATLGTEPALCSTFEEFLAPDELKGLTAFALENEAAFHTSQVIAHDGNYGRTDYGHRRSKVLFHLGNFERLVSERLRHFFPRIAHSLGLTPFPVTQVEVQLTASRDGEYFRTHNDNTHPALARRCITYVLFFYLEPKPFFGGELRLYDTRREAGQCTALDSGVSITPRQNMAVFFRSNLMHEVATIRCAEGAFRNSRFTVNGWIHR